MNAAIHLTLPSRAHTPQRLRQSSVGLVVAGLHLLGLWLWLTSGYTLPTTAQRLGSTPITVWLPQLLQPVAPAATSVPPESNLTRDKKGPQGAATTSLAAPPSTTADPGAGTAAPHAQGAQEPAAPATRALNLALPRGTLSTLAAPSLAARTPFRGRLPATIEQQIETAAGETGPWTEERLDYDHIRYRRGNTCITLERPAASRIDPSNDALQRLPWMANTSDTTCK